MWTDYVTFVTRTEAPGMVIWPEYRDIASSSSSTSTLSGCGVVHVCLDTRRVEVKFGNPAHTVNKRPMFLTRPDEITKASYIFSNRLTKNIIDRFTQEGHQTIRFSSNDVVVALFDEADFHDVVLPWWEACKAQAES